MSAGIKESVNVSCVSRPKSWEMQSLVDYKSVLKKAQG